jgi:lipoyl(octanoyl) transferase
VKVIDCGILDYAVALSIQVDIHDARVRGEIDDVLLLVEHPAVITLGRRGTRDHILASDDLLEDEEVSVFEVNRGGDVTYHGPGQLVGYPIIDLKSQDRDVRRFVKRIEDCFVRLLLNEYQIAASVDDQKYTGVWVGKEKITAIGIAVSRCVSLHGFAFNINTKLEHFQWIVPCGITDPERGVTSLERLTGKTQDFQLLKKSVAEYFSKSFNELPEWTSLEKLKEKK